MLWQKEELDLLYRDIRKKAASGGSTVLLLVAQDVDALCASRVLAGILRSDNVSYKVKPVLSYDDLDLVYNAEMKDNYDLRSVVLLNCGGRINLREKYPLEEGAVYYVLDSHRPLYHVNLDESVTDVVVLEDGLGLLDALRGKNVPQIGDESIEAISSEHADDGASDDDDDSESSDDEDSDSSESGDDGGGGGGGGDDAKENEDGENAYTFSGGAQQRQRKRRRGDRDSDDDDSSDAEDDDGAAGQKRRKVARSKRKGRLKKQRGGKMQSAQDKMIRGRRKRWTQYYHTGSYYGQPASFLAYELATQLNKDSNDALWLTIVGITHQFITEHISKAEYDKLVVNYQQDVMAKNTEGAQVHRMRETSHANQGADGDGDGSGDGDGQEQFASVPSAEEGRIVFEEEYRFMLHRHWSLYDAMYYSNYVASRLGIWKENGRERLQTFLAKMGVSIKECSQKFPFMSVPVKRKLRKKIEDYSEEFKLTDLVYGSFTRHLGYDNHVSAADVAFSTTALLERPLRYTRAGAAALRARADAATATESKKQPVGLAALDHPGTDNAVGAAGTARAADELAERLESKARAHDAEAWEENFNAAYDSLCFASYGSGGSGAGALRGEGLRHSMSLQRAVVSEGVRIMERRSIINTGPFRYLYLEKLSDQHAQFFTQPQVVRKLALFLITAHRANGAWRGAKSRPFLLGVANDANGTVLLVGATCPEEDGASQGDKRNDFGRSFQQAALTIQARFKNTWFDSSVMEIDYDDRNRFIEALHFTMMGGTI